MELAWSSSSSRETGGIQPSLYRLPAETRIGRVRLAVSDLRKSLEFYTRVIGLTVKSGIRTDDPSLVCLGVAGEDTVLLEIQSLPAVHSSGRQRRLGLYHAAYLLPSRKALSSFIEHLNAERVPFGTSDHLYSQAVYLTDPDGFTVEVYADRPREQWRFEGEELLSGVFPLQLSELPQVAPGEWEAAPRGTTVGHVHFFIGDLEKAKTFYHRGMGLDLMTWRYPGALFASAGGYHHHVGLNTWAAGSPVSTESDPRLLFWELVLPDPKDIEEVLLSLQRESYTCADSGTKITSVTDPWGISVHLVSAV